MDNEKPKRCRGRPTKLERMERALAREHQDEAEQQRQDRACACDNCRAFRRARMQKYRHDIMKGESTWACRCVQEAVRTLPALREVWRSIQQCQNTMARMALVWEMTGGGANIDVWQGEHDNLQMLWSDAGTVFDQHGGVHSCNMKHEGHAQCQDGL
jgi:hypothetical protein